MEKVKFSDIFDFQKKSKVKAGKGKSSGKYKFFTSSNIQSKYIDEYSFDKPSLIFGTGGQASVHYCEEKFNVSTDCLVANVKHKEKCYPKFIYYFLAGNIYLLEKEFKGAGLKHISKTAINNLLIPLPPIETQRRIAQILDKADALRRKNQQLLNTYDQLLQSTFLEMFGDPVTNPKGWEKKRLEEIINKIQIGPFGSQLHQADYVNDGIPLINPTNIINQRIFLNSTVKISEEKYISLPQYHLEYGDIVMARRGDMSKVALVNIKGVHLFCGTGSLFVRFSQNTNKIFLHFLLSHEKTTKHLENEAIGVTMPNLNKKIIKNIPVYLPPITLQNQFAHIVENIEAQKSALKKSAKQSDDLFNSLVQQAFNPKPHTP